MLAVGPVGQFDDAATGAVTENQFAPLRITSARRLMTSAAIDTALPAGTNAIGKLASNSGVDIGDVDVLTLPNVTLAAGTNTNEVVGDVAHDAAIAGNPITVGAVASAAAPTDVSADQDAVRLWALRSGALAVQPTLGGVLAVAGNGASGTGVPRVTIANDSTGVLATVSTVTALTGSGIAHDAADSGNPHKIGGRADTTFQAAAADGDRVDALFDVYGVLYARDDHPNKWSYHADGSSALTDAEVQAAAGAGFSSYVTDIIFSNGSTTAMNLFMEEGATKKLGPYYLEAVAGRSIHIRFKTPKKSTANTAITVTTSASAAHTVDILGFIAP